MDDTRKRPFIQYIILVRYRYIYRIYYILLCSAHYSHYPIPWQYYLVRNKLTSWLLKLGEYNNKINKYYILYHSAHILHINSTKKKKPYTTIFITICYPWITQSFIWSFLICLRFLKQSKHLLLNYTYYTIMNKYIYFLNYDCIIHSKIEDDAMYSIMKKVGL
jgi:hypothetical protein